ncbi:MAG: extracellular solute-binding protein [Bacilli bacterium]|nr:extracellular solute-binding protein [Bacilli bacterium]
MKKSKLLTGVISLIALTTIVACGSTTPTETTSSKDNTPTVSENMVDPKVPEDLKSLSCEITFWHTMGKTNQGTLDTLITDFNKAYPNVKITHSQQGGYDDIRDAIAKAIPAQTTPTMAYCYPDHVADYIPSDSVVKLDDYMNSKKIGFGVDNGLGDNGVDDIVATYLDEGNHYTKNGEAYPGYYSLPYSKSTEVMFYNKTVFDENGWSVPTTWDQLWKLCETIKATYPEVTPFGYDSDANFYITYCEQMGIPYTTGEGKEHFLFNNDQAKNFVTKLKEYADKGYWTSQAILGSGTYTSTKFTAEELLMTVGSTGGTTYNYSENFEVGVAAVPQADLSKGKVIMQGPSITFFSSASMNERIGAWLFYKFITNTKNSAIWSVETGYNPIRTSSFQEDIYKNRTGTGKATLVKAVADYMSTSDYNKWYYTSPAFKGSSAARLEVGSLMGAVMLGTKTVDQAFSDALANCLFAA